jgi:nicotinamide riboside kinase
MTIKHLVVGLYGAPGIGKTTAACSLYAELKKTNIPVELAAEFAKEKVLEKNKMAMTYQKYIWINQCYRIYCAYQTAQVVITDAPILLGAIYNKPLTQDLAGVIFDEHRQYNHLNIMLRRNHNHYDEASRAHSLEEAKEIDNKILNLLVDNDIPFIWYDDYTEDDLVQLILESVA